MSPVIAQVDTMGVTAVIATILSVIFAAGAFYNSMQRRRHLDDAKKAEKEEPKMRFRPPSRSTLPTASAGPDGSASASSEAAPVKVGLASASKRSSGGSESLFRQVRPFGSQDGLMTEDADEDGYVWE